MILAAVLGWFLFTLVAVTIGSDRKIGPWFILFVSIIFTPLAGLAIAFASKRKEDEAHEKRVEELLTTLIQEIKK